MQIRYFSIFLVVFFLASIGRGSQAPPEVSQRGAFAVENSSAFVSEPEQLANNLVTIEISADRKLKYGLDDIGW